MVQPTVEDLHAAIRRLPLAERLRFIERVAHEAAGQPVSLLGLMADEPEVVDQMCSLVYWRRLRRL